MTSRILVIKLSALGDFIVALGAMAAIRRHHQGAHITLLTTRPFADMAQRSGYFDDVQVDVRPAFYNLPAWLRLYGFFNRGNYARVYDLQLNDRTKVYYRLFRKKPEWSGVIRGASHFYSNAQWRQMHAFARHKAMLAELGIEITLPGLGWMNSDIRELQPKKPYILLIPGSAPQHLEKRWPAERYGLLASSLVSSGYDVAVLGTKAEAGVIESIKASCPQIHNLCARTSFYDIATLAQGAKGAIGNDTGPTHLVALTGCPTVAIFSGATHPELSAPVGGNVSVIQQQKLQDLSVDAVIKIFRPA